MEQGTPSSDTQSGGPDGAGQQRSGDARKDTPERDFGDSAGYGNGGSALDYHEVLGEDAPPEGEQPPNDPFANLPREGDDAPADQGAVGSRRPERQS